MRVWVRTSPWTALTADGGEGAPIPEPEDEEDLPSDLPSDDDPDDDLTRNAGSTSHNSRKAASSTARAFAFGGKLRPGQSREARGDAWWSGKGEVPQNVSLGLIPVLRDMLARNAQTGGTRAAVLARSGTHIKGVFGFDLGTSRVSSGEDERKGS
jgi:hypothetical protein